MANPLMPECLVMLNNLLQVIENAPVECDGHTLMIKGCFSTLLSHLKAHCKNKSYLLKIESVISQELRRYLVRQMFVFIGEEWECGSGYWVPEDDPVYPSLNTLPY